MHGLRSCVRLLPPGNRTVLESLSALLVKVSEQSKVNCMTESNIATCFAPILVRRQIQSTDMSVVLEESKKGEQIVQLLILHFKYIFDIQVVRSPTWHMTEQDARLIVYFCRPMRSLRKQDQSSFESWSGERCSWLRVFCSVRIPSYRRFREAVTEMTFLCFLLPWFIYRVQEASKSQRLHLFLDLKVPQFCPNARAQPLLALLERERFNSYLKP